MKQITAFLPNLSPDAVPNSVETFDGGSGHQLSHFEYPSPVIRTSPNENKISHRWRERTFLLSTVNYQSSTGFSNSCIAGLNDEVNPVQWDGL
jgi:hypothetical protein